MTTTVLIIDDDKELCALLADFLKLEGFGTRSQHDGAQAVQHCRDKQYDAITLDIILPGMPITCCIFRMFNDRLVP